MPQFRIHTYEWEVKSRAVPSITITHISGHEFNRRRKKKKKKKNKKVEKLINYRGKNSITGLRAGDAYYNSFCCRSNALWKAGKNVRLEKNILPLILILIMIMYRWWWWYRENLAPNIYYFYGPYKNMCILSYGMFTMTYGRLCGKKTGEQLFFLSLSHSSFSFHFSSPRSIVGMSTSW